MSSIALIDRRCAGEEAATILASGVVHSHMLDVDEEGLSVLSGLLSAYPAVEMLHIMVYADGAGDIYLGYNRIDRDAISAYHLPYCDEITLVLHGSASVATADLDALCDDFRHAVGAVVMNSRHKSGIIPGVSSDVVTDFY